MEQFADKWMEVAKQVGGQAWDILVQSVQVNSWIAVGFGGAFLVAFVACWVLYFVTLRGIQKRMDKWTDEQSARIAEGPKVYTDMWGKESTRPVVIDSGNFWRELRDESVDAPLWIFGIGAAISLGGFLIILACNLGGIIFPEGEALKTLLRVMRGG